MYLDNMTDEEFYETMKDFDYTPFEIDSMTKEKLLDEDTFYEIFNIPDTLKRAKIVAELEDRAKKLDCLRAFKKIYNAFIKMAKEQHKPFKNPEHYEIAESLMNENSFAIYDRKLYMYMKGVYQSDDWLIEKRIVERIPEADSHFRKEVYKDLELRNENIKFEKETGIINFKNGLLNVKEMKLYEHTPDFFSINQIPVSFNANAIMVPEVDDFLNKISSNKEERKQAILEMIGYCMTTSVSFQKAFILYGETARNGKSTLCNVITALLGQDNISNVSLKDMSNNIFSTAGIQGKLLNIGAEMTEEYLKDTSIFKMLTTGDSLAVEEKFKSKRTISPYAKLIFNANALPVVSDKSNGFYRRLHIIPLENSFTEEDSKKFDINKILSKEALEYLAKIAIEAYSAMDRMFANHEESDSEVKKYKMNANSVVSFIRDSECNPLYREKGMIAQEVYDKYKDYCIANQYQILGRNSFYQEVEKSGFVSESKKDNQKYYILSLK